MRAPLRQLAACVTLVAAFGPADAHHSTAQFDTNSEVTFEGIVTRYDFKNPHVYMAVEMTGADGRSSVQEVEAGASSVLLPLGLTADSVEIGERVTITASPNRRGDGNIVLGRYLTKAGGEALPLYIRSRSVRRGSEAQSRTIEGTWFAPQEGFFALTQNRMSWPLTDKGSDALASFDGTTQSAHAACVPVTAPTLMVYPVTTVIEVTDETVVFNVDWMSSRRVVYMDGRPHPADGERSLHGHSVGHWEGDTLVVDTTSFSDHREGLAFGIPSGAGKRVVERFTINPDGRHLDYSATIDDPEFLAAPVTHSSQLEYRPDLEPAGLACELDVARRFLEDAGAD